MSSRKVAVMKIFVGYRKTQNHSLHIWREKMGQNVCGLSASAVIDGFVKISTCHSKHLRFISWIAQGSLLY